LLKSSSRNDFNIPEVGQGVQMEILRNNSIHRFRIFDEINQTIILKVNLFLFFLFK
jgi:hypothetical protein